MIAHTSTRVSQNTADAVNEQIRRQTEQNIAPYANADPDEIQQRLDELDCEWDIERYLETLAPSLTLFGVAMSITHSRKWLVLPAIVQTFFLQHAIQGWCPPMPFLRRMGVRTLQEIDRERYALKALRGDFDRMRGNESATPRDRATEALRTTMD